MQTSITSTTTPKGLIERILLLVIFIVGLTGIIYLYQSSAESVKIELEEQLVDLAPSRQATEAVSLP